MNPDETTPTETTTENTGTQTSAEILINMEAMIKNYIGAIEKQADEAKKLKEMLDDIFENDPTFKEHKGKSQETAKILAGTKAQILKRPQAADLADKIKNLKNEQRENQDALSDYLQEYQRLSGATEIETEDGKLHQIVYTAKLVRK
jgi:hypothetical protein